MSARKPRVYVEGAGTATYVIGTDDAHAACASVGISPETHCWGSTEFGLFARRQGRWRFVTQARPPKDARPGVLFMGRIRPLKEEN